MSILDTSKLKDWYENIKDFIPSSEYGHIPFDIVDKYKSYRFSNMNLPIVKMGFNDYRLVLTKCRNKNELIEEMSSKNFIKTLDKDFNIVYELVSTIDSVYFSGKDFLHPGIESRIKEGLRFLFDNRSYDSHKELILFGKNLEYGKTHHSTFYDVLEDNLKQLEGFKPLKEVINEINHQNALINSRVNNYRRSGLNPSSTFGNYNN